MPEPTPNQLGWADNRLTNIALDYAAGQITRGNYIASEVFPVVPVDLPNGKYPVWPRSYFLRDEVAVRPLGGPPRKVTYRMSTDSYSADEEALQADLDPRERASYVGPPSGSPEAAKVRQLQLQHLIHRDVRWAAKYMKTGVWGQDLTGVASGPGANQFLQWDNANSDPIGLVDSALDIVGDKVGGTWRPNVLVLGNIAYRYLKNHAGLLARLGVNNLRQINKQTLATLLELDKVLVPQGIKNTGPEKETVAATESAAVYSRIVGPKDALLVYAANSPSMDEPSGGYTFAWTGLLGAQAFDPTAAVFRGVYTDGSRSQWFQVAVAYDFKVVAPELGVYFSGAVG
jgi:hypothetical protein